MPLRTVYCITILRIPAFSLSISSIVFCHLVVLVKYIWIERYRWFLSLALHWCSASLGLCRSVPAAWLLQLDFPGLISPSWSFSSRLSRTLYPTSLVLSRIHTTPSLYLSPHPNSALLNSLIARMSFTTDSDRIRDIFADITITQAPHHEVQSLDDRPSSREHRISQLTHDDITDAVQVQDSFVPAPSSSQTDEIEKGSRNYSSSVHAHAIEENNYHSRNGPWAQVESSTIRSTSIDLTTSVWEGDPPTIIREARRLETGMYAPTPLRPGIPQGHGRSEGQDKRCGGIRFVLQRILDKFRVCGECFRVQSRE